MKEAAKRAVCARSLSRQTRPPTINHSREALRRDNNDGRERRVPSPPEKRGNKVTNQRDEILKVFLEAEPPSSWAGGERISAFIRGRRWTKIAARLPATLKGRRALAIATVEVRELFSELLEEEHPENGPLHETAASKDLIKELATHLKFVTLPKLRQGASKLREAKAQALLETAAEVVEGLIKAFRNYEKRSEVQR